MMTNHNSDIQELGNAEEILLVSTVMHETLENMRRKLTHLQFSNVIAALLAFDLHVNKRNFEEFKIMLNFHLNSIEEQMNFYQENSKQ